MSVYISIYIRSYLFYLCGYDNTACEYFRLRKFFYAIVSFVLGIIKMLATRRLKTFILYFLFYTKSSRGVLLAIYLVVTQFFKFVLNTVMEEEDFPYFSLEFNFPSIQETTEKPNQQQQQARRFPSLQEEALSLVSL